MYINTLSLSIVLSLASKAWSNPVQRSASLVVRADPEPSDYPYGTPETNEFKWVNWDPENEDDKTDGKKIHQAFVEWKNLVAKGAGAAATKDGATFVRWMGKDHEDPAVPDETKKVFANMWDGSNASDKVAKMVCDRKDFDNFCTDKRSAYMKADTGRFHVCPRGLKSPQLTEIVCGNLDKSCSAKMRDLAMTLLHEMTHFNEIGAAARGEQAIIDTASGAYDCFVMDDNDKPDNAQNYAWLAGEAYFADTCSKTFEDPDAGVKSDDDEDGGVDGGSPSTGTGNPGIPPPQCPGTTAANPPISFSPQDGRAAIDTLCNDKSFWDQAIVPQVSFGTGLTSDGRHKALGASANVTTGGNDIWADISFSTGACVGTFQIDQGANDAEKIAHCVDHFTPLIYGCLTNIQNGDQIGGEIDDVCAVYRLSARPAGQGDPFAPIQDPGSFDCVKFDTTALGPNSGLDNTCQCHYSNIPGPTDLFKMPPSGDCKDANRSDLVNN